MQPIDNLIACDYAENAIKEYFCLQSIPSAARDSAQRYGHHVDVLRCHRVLRLRQVLQYCHSKQVYFTFYDFPQTLLLIKAITHINVTFFYLCKMITIGQIHKLLLERDGPQ